MSIGDSSCFKSLYANFIFSGIMVKTNGGIRAMSIQSDVEMLSIQTLEYYAGKHLISEQDDFDLFYKYQVFENS